MSELDLSSSIRYVKGIGEATSKLYEKLKIHTIFDLLDYWPKRYEDYSQVLTISKMKPGKVTLKVSVKQAKGRYVRKGLHITEAIASDKTGNVKLVWFNQPYRAQSLKQDQEYYVTGEFGLKNQRLQITNPTCELVSDFPLHSARIVPVYKETKGLKSASIRRAIKHIIEYIRLLPETLPQTVIETYDLMSRNSSVEQIHLPSNAESIQKARYRMGFEEVFRLSAASYLNKIENAADPSIMVPFDEKIAKEFVKNLPFTLTGAQKRAVWQAYSDMQKSSPMNRLVEGDVGSGKTAVAAMVALMSLHAGQQVVLIAPTEVLARQHYISLKKLLSYSPFESLITLLVGSTPKKDKILIKKDIKEGKLRFIVGTHALLEDDVELEKLALVIVDEQHRFGVEQRKKLIKKSHVMPHLLSLTATPIPRTLALTLYGELEVSILDELPKGRKGIKTSVYEFGAYSSVLETMRKELDNGRQAFVVCPLITEEEFASHRSVEKVYREMVKTFKNKKVALLHGKMKADEKNNIMHDFTNGKTDIIVSTTVIEVGVDVPNATVMIIESAERFGLAQLHQLRGRVGRGEHAGHCLLVASPDSPISKRLKLMEYETSGFKLAELDLHMRGPGAIYGTSQHGELDLRVANLEDEDLIKKARLSAIEFINSKPNLLQYPELYTAIKNLRKITNLN